MVFYSDGDTALHIAISEKHEDIVDLLISKGADIEKKNYEGTKSLNPVKTKSRFLLYIQYLPFERTNIPPKQY